MASVQTHTDLYMQSHAEPQEGAGTCRQMMHSTCMVQDAHGERLRP